MADTAEENQPNDHTALQPVASPADYLLKVTMRPLEEFRKNPHNARTHSKAQIGQIATSIEQFGFTNPILIDDQGVVLAGHGRLAAAKRLRMSQVPVIVLSHLTEAEKRAYVLADNKLALNAGWDSQMLADELGELSVLLPDMDLDLDITGFDVGEIDQLLLDHAIDDDGANDADTPAPIGPQVTMRGDLWQLGQHRILCGDARAADIVDRLMTGASAAMVITDPPYNVRVQGHVGGRGKVQHAEFAFASGEMTPQEYRRFLKACLTNMTSVSVDGGLLYVFMDWRHIEELLKVGRKLGLELKNLCVWNKTTPGQGSFYRSAHELVAVFAKPGAKSINNIALGKHGRNRTNVWTYPGVNTFKTGTGDDLSVHPTVKPVTLISEVIKDASKRDAIILDPFAGSGTILLAAEKVGRRAHAIEYEPGYVDIAIRRWQRATGKDAVLRSTQSPDRLDHEIGLTFDELSERRASAIDAQEIVQ